MGILPIIILITASIVMIVWAIDIPTTKWEGFRAPPRRRKTLLNILEAILTIDSEEAHVETKAPATTYSEAFKRMQDREEARLLREASESDSS
jgi:hypothetical protein